MTACAPSVSTPGLLPQEVVASSIAATFTAMPSATATHTNTPLPPSSTPPRPTKLPTQNFLATMTAAPSVTPMDTLTPIPTSTDARRIQGSSGYNCKLLEMNPPDKSTYLTGKTFFSVWVIQNMGPKDWDSTAIDIVFLEGSRLHTDGDTMDMKTSVLDGQNLQLTMKFQAPQSPGEYTSVWGLKKGSTLFCKFSITIKVAGQ